MPRPSPATVNHIGGLFARPDPARRLRPEHRPPPCHAGRVTMQHGMNVGDLALSNLFTATDDDQSIDPEAIQARGRAVCVEEQLNEAGYVQVMAQSENNIALVYRLQGLHAMAAASRRQQLQQALDPANAVTGIAKGAAEQAGAIGPASAAAGT